MLLEIGFRNFMMVDRHIFKADGIYKSSCSLNLKD